MLLYGPGSDHRVGTIARPAASLRGTGAGGAAGVRPPRLPARYQRRAPVRRRSGAGVRAPRQLHNTIVAAPEEVRDEVRNRIRPVIPP